MSLIKSRKIEIFFFILLIIIAVFLSRTNKYFYAIGLAVIGVIGINALVYGTNSRGDWYDIGMNYSSLMIAAGVIIIAFNILTL